MRTLPATLVMASINRHTGVGAVIPGTTASPGAGYDVIPGGGTRMALAPTQSLVDTPSRAYYRQALEVLTRSQVPFLIGGAFAFVHQAGIDRSTKDLDIFVRPGDVHRLLEVCAAAGYSAELVFSHWLAKIRSGDSFIDVIFSSGNGVAVVDDHWFAHATEQSVLGLNVLVAPAEESVWSKAFV